jgi:predicted metalloprotease with PDZ domain
MRTAVLALVLLFAASAAAAAPTRTTLVVDARKAPERVLRATQTLPVAAGAVTLSYPKWIPGEHGPSGPLDDVVSLVIEGGGKKLAWKRDPVEMYQLHVDVPKGADALTIAIELLLPATDDDGVTSTTVATRALALVQWNQLLLYPSGTKSDDLEVAASLRLPAKWRHGTSLAGKKSGDTVAFTPVSLTTLVDSPVLAGAHAKTFTLREEPPVSLFAAGDSADAIALPPEATAELTALVDEAMALFGARHFERYTFLLMLSDAVGYQGLEHHSSSDNRIGERAMLASETRRYYATLLPHELVHSWNGKYRRPRGMATPDFDTPAQTELLWIYEGLTQYLGWVLATRAGMWTVDDALGELAFRAASLDHTAGRTWRSLADTGTAAQRLYAASERGSNARRGVDFYDEGLLVWLEVDTIIRRESKGAKSLDDFCRAFFGGADTAPAVVAYDLADVTAALDKVVTYEWTKHFATRVTAVAPRAPTGGITGGGWKLAYATTLSPWMELLEDQDGPTDVMFSLGLLVDPEGTIVETHAGGPADRAGVVANSTLVAVDDREYDPKVLRRAIAGAKKGTPIELLVKLGAGFHTVSVPYAGGERYPHLVRDETATDLLAAILAGRRK